jgi:hypothetical protein
LPMPPGVPAGGIFNQAANHSIGTNVSVLYLDPVAVDLSASTPFGSSGSASAIHGGQSGSLVAQPATTTLGLGNVRPSLISASHSNARLKAIETATRPGRSRAELPDIATLAPDKVPGRPGPNAVGYVDPTPSNSLIADQTNNTQKLTVLVSVPGMAVLMKIDKVQTDELESEKQRISANLAIYSAASLTVGVSAPGLTSMIRRDKRRLIVTPGARSPGSPH